MWSSSVSLKLMLLFHEELWMLLLYSDRSKPLQCGTERVGKACGNSCAFIMRWVLTYSGCWTEKLLLLWLYEGSDLDEPLRIHIWAWSLRSCGMDLEEYFIFLYFASFCSFACSVLFRSQQLHDLCFWSVWKWSSDHCTVTGFLKHFNMFVWEKRLENRNTPALSEPLYIDSRWIRNVLF